MSKKLQSMELGNSKTFYHSQSPTYKRSLLYPECVHNARVPGMADATVVIKRKLTYNLTTNTLGAAGIVWQPFGLSDNSANLSTFYINNNSTYDGINTVGSTNALAIATNQAITAGAVSSYRLVSAAMHVIPQASVLNQAGTIHGGVIKAEGAYPRTVGTAFNDSTVTLLPNFQNAVYYAEASVSGQEGLRLIWIPNDPCLLEFDDVNTNESSAKAESTNTLVVDILGTASAAPFRIDLFWNFEVTPAVGSILHGMENFCEEDQLPTQVWRDILTKHSNEIVMGARSIQQVVNAKDEAFQKTQKFSKPTLGSGLVKTIM